MVRSAIYLKVIIEHDDDRPAHRVSGEVVRAVKKLYGVREVEISNMVSEPHPDPEL